MNTFFKELFDYNYYNNKKIIDVLLANHAPEKAITLQNHIINAHQVWNSRIIRETPFGVWEMHSSTELLQLDEANYKKSIMIIESVDLSKTIDYKTSNGQPFSNLAKDTLFQVINHSTYHRGQIASLCKQQGIEPPATDYILYKR